MPPIVLNELTIINGIVGLCVAALFSFFSINFLQSQEQEAVKKEKKSIVETGTMTGFFVLIYLIIVLRIWHISIDNATLRLSLEIVGVLMIISGTIFNIYGRFFLGKNWGNQIRIYKNHSLVTTGTFSLVRHPLYASIIAMFYGASLVNSNWLVFVATLCIFVPFMKYRAGQEEKMLTETFPEYSTYQERVGMFFPHFFLKGNPSTPISNYEFLFCRISLTLLVWASFLWKIELLSILVFVLLFLSVVFRIGHSPMILLYRYTIWKFLPGKQTLLSINAMRLAHAIGASLLFISLVVLSFVNTEIGWLCILGFALIKSISALGFCPVAKLYTCAGSGCCPFFKRFK